jgi:arylsulfatase A-like enzyme
MGVSPMSCSGTAASTLGTSVARNPRTSRPCRGAAPRNDEHDATRRESETTSTASPPTTSRTRASALLRPGLGSRHYTHSLLTRRHFLRTGALASASAPLLLRQAAETQGEGRKPNIIFVFADQMRSQVLSCYGNQQVSTPHIDRIADEGVRFDNAISAWPVCSPFRAMLMTGLYPMHNGTVANDTAARDGLPTIATVCKANGYETAYIGKWHLEWTRDPFVPKERRRGFDFWASRNCSHQYFDSFYCGDTPEHVPLPGYEPEAQAKLAADYIRQHRDRPFCLFLSWGPPHDPYTAPDPHLQQFPVERLGLRPNVPESDTVHRLLATDPSALSDDVRKRRGNWRKILEDDGLFRERCLRGYYAATKALDDCMGILLAALDETGLSDDTILVFSSDHGDMMGSHRMVSKQMPHEESISIPFLLRYPRTVPAGTRTDALLSPIDIMPTLLGLAGVERPAGLDGRDIGEAARGLRSDQREAVLLMKLLPGGNPWIANGVTTWRGVRTKRHTYARLLDRGPWLLFDNEADPYQMQNLINQPEHAALQRELDEITTQLMEDADDPGEDEPIRAFRQSRRPKP